MRKDENEVIKVYVGTDPRMKKAEIALEYSIRSQTQSKVDIIWMDAARGGLWGGWNIGRDPGNPYPEEGWATDFSCFRFAIPEANGFKGRAIYLDVDMILIRDIKELFNFPMGFPILITPKGFDVMLYDCSAFEDERDWWPSIEEMKKSGWNISNYAQLLLKHQMVGPLSPIWNCCDGVGYSQDIGLVHFTDMNTQPWKPYPERFAYPPHPCPDMVALWEKFYEEGLKHLSAKL